MNTLTTKTKPARIPAMQSGQCWAIYDLRNGEVAYISMSRQDARDYRSNQHNMSNFSGARKVNFTIRTPRT